MPKKISEELKIKWAKRFFKESGLNGLYMCSSFDYIPIYRDDIYKSYNFFKMFIWDSIKHTSYSAKAWMVNFCLEERGLKFLTPEIIKDIELKLFNKPPTKKQMQELQEIMGY